MGVQPPQSVRDASANSQMMGAVPFPSLSVCRLEVRALVHRRTFKEYGGVEYLGERFFSNLGVSADVVKSRNGLMTAWRYSPNPSVSQPLSHAVAVW